jgi:hypothetical protein
VIVSVFVEMLVTRTISGALTPIGERDSSVGGAGILPEGDTGASEVPIRLRRVGGARPVRLLVEGRHGLRDDGLEDSEGVPDQGRLEANDRSGQSM